MNCVHLAEIIAGACGSGQEVLRGKQEWSEILRKQTGANKRFCRSEQKSFCGRSSQSEYPWQRMDKVSVGENGLGICV